MSSHTNSAIDNSDVDKYYDPEETANSDSPSAEAENLVRITSNRNTLERLETLTQQLSTHTSRNGSINLNLDDFDLEYLLKHIIRRSDRDGIKSRYSGIRFKNVTAHGIDISASYAATVGDVFRIFNDLPNKLKSVRHPKTRKLISDISGVINPGEMVLVLGRPGSGCSTFLRSLAGETSELKAVEGDISFNGIPQKTMMKEFKGDVIYNSECKFFFVLFPMLIIRRCD